MTPEEVARILNIKKNTVYEMIKRGELNAYRVGRKLRIDEDNINKYKAKMHDEGAFYKENLDEETFIICGQDMILDILCRFLEEENPNKKILRSYKGSYNGLYALYNDQVSVATCHLWHEETNTYNEVYVKGLLPGIPFKIIPLVKRTVGFYVKKGNPKNIYGWEDLKRDDIKFINREKGSGIRVLLDEKINLLNIKTKDINGYNSIATSHVSVATSVARNDYDFGIGNEKCVKQINGLDFIPLQKENYDMVVKKMDLEKPIVQNMLSIINSEKFREEIISLGDYEL